MTATEEVVSALQSERVSEAEAATLREARLDEQIGILKAEKVQLLARPSSSHTSSFLDMPRDSYENCIHAEAQLNIFRDLMVAKRVTELEFEGARAKAREARVACVFDPATPRADSGEDELDGVEQDAWYDDEYPNGGEGIGGEGGDDEE